MRRSGSDVIPAGGEAVSRVFGAPRDLVFEVWTKAEHFTRWSGPHGAEVISCEIDARPGGIIRFGHRFAGGTTLHLKGTFCEVILNERLVFTFGFVDEHGHPVRHPMFPDWPLDVSIETIVILDAVADETRVRVVHRVLPADAASHPATKRWSPLALEGSRQVLDRLAEHLSLTAARAARKLLERESNAPVPFGIDDAAQWPPSVYAWFTLDGIPGGTDAYFEPFTAEDRNIWLGEISTPHYASWASEIQASLEVGHRWRFRRSAGQPCVITAAYGLLAASLARLTDGVIESGDSAWDHDRLPTVPRDFILNYLNPQVEVQQDFDDWTR